MTKPTPGDRLQAILEKIQSKRTHGTIFRSGDAPAISILNGNRFMVSSREGDMFREEHGVFANDTRFLSRYRAKINGAIPIALTSSNTTHYSAGFYLTNPSLSGPIGGSEGRIRKESIAIHRMRFIGRDIREEYFATNTSGERLRFKLSFELDADFSDIFEVKRRVFAERPDVIGMGDATKPKNSRKFVRKTFLSEENSFDFSYEDPDTRFRARTLCWFSKQGKVTHGQSESIAFDVTLEPRSTFHLVIVIVILPGGEKKKRKYTDEHFERRERRIARNLESWHLAIPNLDSNWDDLKHAYYQSLVDIASLKMTDPTERHRWQLPAAGCPWFMTLFGRDTLITSYQTTILGTGFAKGAIEALARYQAKKLDPRKDAEPGKIIHELRFGEYAASSERFPYYGTIDATPLFLILISEVYRWTGDAWFTERLRNPITNALTWVDKYGDMDGDGFLEYQRKTEEGLENQCWKDSWNSIQYSDGRIAEPPIATCEVQGYVYDAKMRIAEIAREVWKDSSLAKKLLDEANELKERFDEEFWIEEKGYYALALDKEKKQVDSMTSNNGQLLWSGIVDREKVDLISEKLLDRDHLFSGYGVRTLSAKDEGYSPLGYHNGCVWAHDNSLIAEGLAKYGKTSEASEIIDSILSTGPHFSYTMPETFAGFPRLHAGFPVRYPTSSSPQAWAAGAAFLFLRTLLGLDPDRNRRTIRLDPVFSDKLTTVELDGVEAFGERFVINKKEGSKFEIFQASKQ